MTATEAQRRRVNDLFAELCRIESPFGHERACADRVAAELRSMGLEVEEDGAGPEAGSECGNLLARVPGASGAPVLLLCAHLDTVVPQAPIEPVCDEGVWRNSHPGILGADNKAAVAVMLEVARAAAAGGAACGLELLFTVCEENALRGAKVFDRSRLRADAGYVFDHATPIGEVVMAAPSYFRVDAEFHGASAHAGIRPQDGRNAVAAASAAVAAMRLGRLDDETTANVGRIEGGSASLNVVPDRCRIEAETRSLDDAKVEASVADMVDRVHDGANAWECDVDVQVECLFRGFRVRPSAPVVVAAEAALRACGFEPRRIVTGGGSDANVFVHEGLPVLNLANGTRANHQPDESVAAAALGEMLGVALRLPSAFVEAQAA
ncbi:MAG TPA: M20/M25/M40 family metallo-hydrolase [Solirubrobacteraceae bacterium]|nr:M20/M25/M40 family metallo-hydrolase [Solirubrobacteraceae bacterium]